MGRARNDFATGTVMTRHNVTNELYDADTGRLLLITECWCMRREVLVPAADVRRGRTLPCNLEGCREGLTRRQREKLKPGRGRPKKKAA